MWPALIGGALSLFGAHKQQKHEEKMANQAAWQNQQTVNSMLGDMATSREQMGYGYSAFRDFTSDYAARANEEPWRVAADFAKAREAYDQYAQKGLSSLADAAIEREQYGTAALGHISGAQDLILKDQQRAREMNQAQLAASGTVGTAAAGQASQLAAMQADQLESAAVASGREAAGLTTAMGRDIMGLRQQGAGYEMGMADFMGQLGLSEAGALANARLGGMQADLMHGQTFLDERSALARNFEDQARLRMGVQHTAAPSNANYAATYGAIGDALGGIDWGSMFGGPSPGQPIQAPGTTNQSADPTWASYQWWGQ